MASYVSSSEIVANPNLSRAGEVLACGIESFLSVCQQNAHFYVQKSHPEALHQYRVALRRSRSLLKANKKALPANMYSDLNQTLRNLVEQTNALRDSEVFIEQLRKYRLDLTEPLQKGRKRMLEDLRWEMTKQRNNVQSWFESSDYARQMNKAQMLLAQNGAFFPQVNSDEVVPGFLYKQNKWLSQRIARLDKLSVQELHEFRIRIKNLRYTISFYPEWENQIDLGKVRKIQDHLGLLHDFSIQHDLAQRYIAQKQLDDKNLKSVALFVGYIERFLSEQSEYHLVQVRGCLREVALSSLGDNV